MTRHRWPLWTAMGVALAAVGCAPPGPKAPAAAAEALRASRRGVGPRGGGLSFLRAGDPSGPCVVLVHGTPGSATGWVGPLAAHRLLGFNQQVLSQALAVVDAHASPGAGPDALQVLGQGGVIGDFQFSVASSVGRELAFLASHALHHFALLAAHLQRHGIALSAHFGKAPGTVSNDIATGRVTAPMHTHDDTQAHPCLPPVLSP